jgi:hypothetical protein
MLLVNVWHVERNVATSNGRPQSPHHPLHCCLIVLPGLFAWWVYEMAVQGLCGRG